MMVTMIVDGRRHTLDLDPRRTLADVLREDLGRDRIRRGCADGTCFTCGVTVDGVEVCACLLLAVQCDGALVRLPATPCQRP
jgi:carbon-monoxide dehydrogenase small subunit